MSDEDEDQERAELKRRGRRIDIATKAGFWIVLGLILLILLWLMKPLFRAIGAL